MLNYNSSGTIPVHNSYVWSSNQLVTPVSAIEKQEIISSLLFLGPNFNDFVNSFYKTFQERKLDDVFKSSEESLVNSLSSSLNLLITSLEQPDSLKELAPTVIERYPNLKNLVRDKNLFLKSFMGALVDTFKNNYNDRLGLLWYKALFKVVSEFRVQIIMKNLN